MTRFLFTGHDAQRTSTQMQEEDFRLLQLWNNLLLNKVKSKDLFNKSCRTKRSIHYAVCSIIYDWTRSPSKKQWLG